MTAMRRWLLTMVVAALGVAGAPARAQQAPPSVAGTTSTGDWGWLVLGYGVLVGGSVTVYGLTFDCSDSNTSCQRKTSLLIWGGAGIAALASAVGISIVQSGRQHVQVTPVAGADRVGVAVGGAF
jgi:hypothetical protein